MLCLCDALHPCHTLLPHISPKLVLSSFPERLRMMQFDVVCSNIWSTSIVYIFTHIFLLSFNTVCFGCKTATGSRPLSTSYQSNGRFKQKSSQLVLKHYMTHLRALKSHFTVKISTIKASTENPLHLITPFR